MAVREGPWQSINDHDFILRSLRKGKRVDGRRLEDMRLLRMVFSRAEGQSSAEIQLGRTRVLAVATGEVVPPFPDRATEGFLHFNVELSSMAATGSGERSSLVSAEIARVIEIGVRDSQALDTEALCIIGGEKVWQIRCDIHVLDHGGNLMDACTLATMAALRHFRRPEVTVNGSSVIVHHSDDKEPLPLALHHVPICITFAVFEDTGDFALARAGAGANKRVEGGAGAGASSSVAQYVAVDPTEAEEEVMKGKITFALTVHKELCALHKNGGVAVTRGTILGCARLAATKVEEVHKLLDRALAGADAKAALDRQRRLRGTTAAHPTAPARFPGTVPEATAGGRIQARLPGTQSTPFVVARTPLPVDAESLKVKHLDYDDLHVTQSIREEGLRGGNNRRARGLEMSDARSTELFAKMAKAASMTEARIAQVEAQHGTSSDSSGARSSPPVLPPVSGKNGTVATAAAEARAAHERRPGGGARRQRGSAKEAPPGVGRGGGGTDDGGEVERAAHDEFETLAKKLQHEPTKVESGRALAKGKVDRAFPAPMDVADSREGGNEAMTLEGGSGPAAGAEEATIVVVVPETAREKQQHQPRNTKEQMIAREGTNGGAGHVECDDHGDGDGDGDDDLLSAVKAGRGRSGGSRGKAKGGGKKKKERT